MTNERFGFDGEEGLIFDRTKPCTQGDDTEGLYEEVTLPELIEHANKLTAENERLGNELFERSSRLDTAVEELRISKANEDDRYQRNVKLRETNDTLRANFEALTKQRDRETRGTTHSDECWRWHVECAERHVESLQLEIGRLEAQHSQGLREYESLERNRDYWKVEAEQRGSRLGDLLKSLHASLAASEKDYFDMPHAVRHAVLVAEGRCPMCYGNDRDMPCAYPSQDQPGCLRDVRLAASAVEKPFPK